MLAKWVLIVAGVNTSSAAIAGAFSPLAASSRTSTSRGVSGVAGSEEMWGGCFSHRRGWPPAWLRGRPAVDRDDGRAAEPDVVLKSQIDAVHLTLLGEAAKLPAQF